MSISLIVGPPNSGRAGEVRRRLLASLDREPVLVVPTADDAARFEADLCEAAGDRSILGAETLTFRRLFEELAPAAGIEASAPLSAPQRLALVRAAARATPLTVLARSARRPGFGAALDSLIVELQAAQVGPDDLERAAEALDDPELELELAAIYRTYFSLRDEAGRPDEGAIATALLLALGSGPPQGWQERPVFLYGFDDLTRAQLDLIDRLGRACEVTIAVNFEDRRALTARASLLTDLVEELGATREPDLPHEAGYTRSVLLRHLDRNLFEPGAPPSPRDEGLSLLECAGALGEAEAIGAEVARLLAGGADPDDIAIVVRHPAATGPLIGRVLGRLGIPVAVEADVPLARTATGRALVALCRAAGPGGSAEDMLAYLRADASMRPGGADWVERRIRRGDARTAADAVATWEWPPRHWQRLREQRDAAGRLRALGRIAVALAEAPHAEQAPTARDDGGGTPFDPVELRAGRVAAELLGELAEVGALPACEQPDLADAAEAIEAASVPLWRGSTEGRVRVLSPYRIRAGRARYLFCSSLQEGEFPGTGAVSPLLGEERRKALGLRALRRQPQADEERYLFHACVSRPTERLYLTWRSATEDGAPQSRSPFVDEVLDLVAPDPEAAEEALKRSHGLERTTFALDSAPTPRELARALAARGRDADHAGALEALRVDGPARDEVLAALAAVPPAGKPGPLRNPAVLENLGGRSLLSANSLEGWIECSYRWFVDHELTPQRLELQADPLWLGGVVHDALERLYREAPGSDSIPRPADVAAWRRRLGELLAEKAADGEGRPPTGDRALALARARAQAERFLDEEAASETELRPDPELLERGFGFEGEEATPGDPGALDLGGIGLRGRIDRIDVAPDGRGAVIRDYKTGKNVTGAKAFEDEGKLQLQLYMRVARDQLDLDVIGGLYQPLGARGKYRRPRGIVTKGDERLDGLELVGTDRVEPDDFESELDRAVAEAIAEAARMRGGAITRDPIGGSCPSYCRYHPICRIERALGPVGENGNGDD